MMVVDCSMNVMTFEIVQSTHPTKKSKRCQRVPEADENSSTEPAAVRLALMCSGDPLMLS